MNAETEMQTTDGLGAAPSSSVATPVACEPCLSRGRLLADLAPYIERAVQSGGQSVEDLMALTDEDLRTAVGGQNAPTYALQDLLRPVEVAGCWSICPHTATHEYPSGLSALVNLGAIYGRGDPRELRAIASPGDAVSIIGARRASSYGREVARELGRDVAHAGFAVVSGMAFGIDACAHRGALEEEGTTVAVLGCGPDVAYPATHRSLWRRIQESGLILSQLPPGTGAWRWAFVARSQLIAALTGMTVCVEAARPSGSFAAVKAAKALGRKVGAVPGPVTSRVSVGTNAMLADDRQVAVVRYADDVVETMRTP